ncbi:hypothetical protein C2845_PM17G12130 [Panicum miliaceum]|uniref:RING-type domain-containing protein n=1 Tax=Panicum miliaceum TaxID=4540 RepID=A0A3L6Q2P8_PANMI|nr:hypothetical protein C2845_PM17G12130 [Panicum miliaceum]
MPMLAAVTCLARRRRMHCRGGSHTAPALELNQGQQHGPGDHRHRWRDDERPEPAPGREHTATGLPRAPLPHASRRQGRRRLPRDGGTPALGSRRRRETAAAAGAEQTPTEKEARSQPGPGTSSAAVASKKAPDDAGRVARRAAEETASAPSPVLCAVCLEEVRGRGGAAEAATLPCSHSYHPGCVLPWLAARGACPCCRAAVPSPENYC